MLGFRPSFEGDMDRGASMAPVSGLISMLGECVRVIGCCEVPTLGIGESLFDLTALMKIEQHVLQDNTGDFEPSYFGCDKQIRFDIRPPVRVGMILEGWPLHGSGFSTMFPTYLESLQKSCHGENAIRYKNTELY